MPNTTRCVGGCNSNYPGIIGENVKILSFPTDEEARKLWFASLPNFVEDSKGKKVCVKHWLEKYETIRKKGHDMPCYPPSIFNVPASFCRQTLSSPREVKKWKIDAESRLEGQLKIEFPFPYTLYDPTHLFKNIKNNWVTEKMKTLNFTDPSSGQIVSAKWSHLVDIF